ncbi:MAG: hypothetical protein ACRDKI_08825 [Solirubrobacterales bacterium]
MRRLLGSLLAAGFALALFAPVTDASVTIGYSPSLPAGGAGGCIITTQCTYFQAADAGSPTFNITQAGVVTSFQINEGTNMLGINTAQLKAFRPNGGSTWKVIGEGPVAPMFVGCCGALATIMPARISVQPGDRLGVGLHLAGDTAWDVGTGSGSDVVVRVSGLDLHSGDVVTPLNLIATGNRMLNLVAHIEPDADGDGYGDETQDLCLGNAAKGGVGCSGYVLGSNFQRPYSANGGCSSPPCLILNDLLSGQMAAAPARGVIVRLRVFDVAADTYVARVLRPEGSDLRSVESSPPLSTSGTQKLATLNGLRIPIQSGDLIGWVSGSGGNHAAYLEAGRAEAKIINPAPGAGSLGTPAFISFAEELLAGADVESDVDGDGYGDETQDACASDPSTQGACPTPAISALKASPPKFRVAPHGAVIAKGTTFKFKLSVASSISWVVSIQKIGRRQGKHGCVKQTAKNRTKKSCKLFVVVHHFVRTAAAGANKFAYSGRYKHGRSKAKLKPGTYKLTGTPSSSASHVIGKSKATTFRVIR